MVYAEKERRERLALEEQKRAIQNQDVVLVKKPSLPTLEDIEQGEDLIQLISSIWYP